jgi:hypothetical protein
MGRFPIVVVVDHMPAAAQERRCRRRAQRAVALRASALM